MKLFSVDRFVVSWCRSHIRKHSEVGWSASEIMWLEKVKWAIEILSFNFQNEIVLKSQHESWCVNCVKTMVKIMLCSDCQNLCSKWKIKFVRQNFKKHQTIFKHNTSKQKHNNICVSKSFKWKTLYWNVEILMVKVTRITCFHCVKKKTSIAMSIHASIHLLPDNFKISKQNKKRFRFTSNLYNATFILVFPTYLLTFIFKQNAHNVVNKLLFKLKIQFFKCF